MCDTIFHPSTPPTDTRKPMSLRHPISRSLSLIMAVAFMIGGLDGTALAHIGDHSGGLAGGITHPFSGLDHMLAMVAVGLWASQFGRPACWLLVATFPLVMAAGALLGTSGLALPWVETAVAGSVLVFGAAIAFALRPSLVASTVLIALFALVHGYSHGIELPAQGSVVAYGAGFILSTLALHLIGFAIGTFADRAPVRSATRVIGAAIAAVGVLLLASV
jgi:urease accessory protein